MKVGDLKLSELGCFQELVTKLSIRLDVPRYIGGDYRDLLERLGVPDAITAFLAITGSPTRKGLEHVGSKVTVFRLVIVLRELERDDCIEDVEIVLWRNLCDENGGNQNLHVDGILELKENDRFSNRDNGNQNVNIDGFTDLKEDVPFFNKDNGLCDVNEQEWTQLLKLVHQLIVLPVITFVYNGTLFLTRNILNGVDYYIGFVTKESYILLQALYKNFETIAIKYLIRGRTDDGFVSFWLMSLSVVERFVLLFLVFNDIVLLTPFWETGHTFSLLEHLVVALPVYISWFMEPRMSRLHETTLEKTAWIQLKEEIGMKDADQHISRLRGREKSEMIEIRNSLMCLVPLQFSVLLGCCYTLSCGGDRATQICYQNAFFVSVVCLHVADVFYRVFVFVAFYITLNPSNRFYFSPVEIDMEKKYIRRQIHANFD
ncbi:uncharacterized protein [Ptychodera flava]|uniref:uncharacterized protein n=1 Tax=Ptychodera flava TaxID=63121 RepID=UPI00396A4219